MTDEGAYGSVLGHPATFDSLFLRLCFPHSAGPQFAFRYGSKKPTA